MYANIYERRHTHPTPIYKHVRKTNLGLYLVPKKICTVSVTTNLQTHT